MSTSAPAVSALVLPGNSFVIVSDFGGGFVGSFTSYVANNVGRGSSDFWANKSADFGGVEACNAGFYAAGSMSGSCINDAMGSDAGSVANVYTKYLADGTSAPKKDATAFMFNGGSTYTVTLKGSYAGEKSDVGWFTKTAAGVYTFNNVAGWSARTVGSTATINTLGQAWGFYIRNGFNVQFDGCGVKTHCSDAEGGFAGATMNNMRLPLQQFALFSNAGGNQFLVGIEDNKLELLSNGGTLDSDYNDFLLEVVPTSVCDFMTFGRSQIETADGKVIVSGNAGGVNSNGIMGTFNVEAGGTKYLVQDITSYGPVVSGPLSGAQYPNARRIVGIAKSGETVEIRMYDGGEPGRVDDAVYLKIGSSVILNAVDLNRGNIQYHANCRGPGSD